MSGIGLNSTNNKMLDKSSSNSSIHGVNSNPGQKLVKLYSGDFYITKDPNEIITTVLGSCIACCARDVVSGVGGMNHFLLPLISEDISIDHSDAARFGAFAMEKLINGLIAQGATRSTLEVKLFGGANVSGITSLIGSKNVDFIRAYVKEENLKIASEHLGGNMPRRVNYYPITGRAMLKLVEPAEQAIVIQKEMNYQTQIKKESTSGGDVELF